MTDRDTSTTAASGPFAVTDRPEGSYGSQVTQDTTDDSGAADQAKQKAGEVKDQAMHKADEVKDQVSQKTDQAKEMSDQGIDRAADGLDRLADTIRERSESDDRIPDQAGMVAEKLTATADYLHGKDTDQLIEDLEAFIRRRPVESVVGAVAIGFLLSKAIK